MPPLTSVSFANINEASQKGRVSVDVQGSYWASGRFKCMEQRSVKGRLGRKVYIWVYDAVVRVVDVV